MNRFTNFILIKLFFKLEFLSFSNNFNMPKQRQSNQDC